MKFAFRNADLKPQFYRHSNISCTLPAFGENTSSCCGGLWGLFPSEFFSCRLKWFLILCCCLLSLITCLSMKAYSANAPKTNRIQANNQISKAVTWLATGIRALKIKMTRLDYKNNNLLFLWVNSSTNYSVMIQEPYLKREKFRVYGFLYTYFCTFIAALWDNG